MADQVQGGIFGGLNFQPLGWDSPTGQPLQPKIVSDPGPTLQQGNVSGLDWNNLQLPSLAGIDPNSFTGTSQGSAGGGSINVPPNGAPSYAIGTPSNAQPTAGQATSQSGSFADYFLRGIIIILGFIFVAVGLNMFRPGIVPNPVKMVR